MHRIRKAAIPVVAVLAFFGSLLSAVQRSGLQQRPDSTFDKRRSPALKLPILCCALAESTSLQRRALLALLIIGAALLGARPSSTETAIASHTVGAIRIYSPVSGVKYVTSPSRFHDGCEPYTTDYEDALAFDNGSCYAPAGGDWAMDIASVDNTAVFIDLEPGTIDGNVGGSVYRVVAGGQGDWGGNNGGYQDFYVQVQTTQGAWENFGVIFLAHIDGFRYSPGSIVVQPTSQRATKVVGDVAPAGTWPEHVHIEGYNYNYWSRTYNWDGPTTDDDIDGTPPCVRSGGSPAKCNAQTYGSDVIGYVGGNKPSFAQVDNAYFQEF